MNTASTNHTNHTSSIADLGNGREVYTSRSACRPVTGGLVLGALFMATDYVTSPVTPRGMLIYGAGCGLLTWLIRSFGGYPEGVSFAILLMNMLTPLIDTYTRPRLFGEVKARA